ncbi:MULTISPECIES: trypsin-like serine protease [Streptomyces]|uniref:trypsin-like serine protease n=1 Tax=Streptomyces TaxID=1883 RepID=UPI001E371176|nr:MULTISPECIES: trypsin-like serine protease [Streptomyces]UFQ19606.1 trypsin-like serine protease [Streptomyces huasconensis]WCL89224.1 trypsin-like serine protease [Streptomyces sp. JCM 35825]
MAAAPDLDRATRPSYEDVLPEMTGTQPIIGGQETKAQPYDARLFKNRQDHCTATMLSARHILTARHCVNTSAQYTFRIGSTHAYSGGTTATAARVTLHASADLAVVKLDRDVTNTPAKIASTYPQRGSNVYGWGATCKPDPPTAVPRTAGKQASPPWPGTASSS